MKLRLTIGSRTILVDANKADAFIGSINAVCEEHGAEITEYGQTKPYTPLTCELRVKGE